MTLKQFLITMTVATLIIWFGWFFVIFNLDPATSGWLGLSFFYITFAIAIIGTLTVAGTLVRQKIKSQEPVFRHVLVSFRQAFWFAILLVVSLLLLANEIFRLWIVFLIITILCLFEMIFLISQHSSKSSKS